MKTKLKNLAKLENNLPLYSELVKKGKKKGFIQYSNALFDTALRQTRTLRVLKSSSNEWKWKSWVCENLRRPIEGLNNYPSKILYVYCQNICGRSEIRNGQTQWSTFPPRRWLTLGRGYQGACACNVEIRRSEKILVA
jgi:hypothetical protein